MLVQGKQLLYAQQEERDQLRRAGYNPILWGVADRAREVFSDVPQAWYQRLLELGNLQVSSWGDGCWCRVIDFVPDAARAEAPPDESCGRRRAECGAKCWHASAPAGGM